MHVGVCVWILFAHQISIWLRVIVDGEGKILACHLAVGTQSLWTRIEVATDLASDSGGFQTLMTEQLL